MMMLADKKDMTGLFANRVLTALLFVCGLTVAAVILPSGANAQEEVVVTDTVVAADQIPAEEPAKAEDKTLSEINPNDIPSLLFTYWEHTAIMEAKRARGAVRPPTDSELQASIPNEEGRPVPPPEERELRLAGIVYVASDDWTIWLNEKRVTPTAVPPEAIDLEVYKEFIELKWHDDYTNQIFPIRLRPHQRFNLDARIFLP